MIILAYVLSGLALVMSGLFLIKTRNPFGWIALAFKLIPGAMSAVWAIMGLTGAVIGWISKAYWAVPMGIVSAGMMSWYIWRVTRDHDGFEQAFGEVWLEQIHPEQARQMVQKRWNWILNMKGSPESSWERDVVFRTIPDYDRELLCDIWRPSNSKVSGLAFIFFHGSGWYLGDKDTGTRPFFRHLVSQGHTVMDVAYRLCPEVDIYDMIGDVKHAIAWMKDNASQFGVDPEKIVLGGGSAGGHLALLAAYAPDQTEFVPKDLNGAELSVRGVISFYGPIDLLSYYYYINLHRLEGFPPVSPGPDATIRKRDNGRLDILLGGFPQEVPEVYQLASPNTHVHPGCPATLLIQGEQDFIASAETTNELHAKLVESGVPAINLVYPWTDHGFDVLLPQINPASQSALYDVDRFLALMLNTEG